MPVFRPRPLAPYLPQPSLAAAIGVPGGTITSVLVAASTSASTTFAATNVPPANTLGLAAAAVSSSVALAATGTLGATVAASALASTVALAVANTPPPNTDVLAAASASSTVAFAVANTLATTLAGAAQSSAAALVVVNTPPPNTVALAAAAQSSSSAFVVASTMAAALGAASVASTVAFTVVETPPSSTSALGAAAASPVVALAVVNAAPGTPVTMAAASASAVAAFILANTPPPNAAALGASAASSTTVMAALNVPTGDAATLGAASTSALASFAATSTPPATTATLGAAAGRASVAFALANVGGTGNTVSLGTLGDVARLDFRVIVAPVANPNLKQAVVSALKASPGIAGIVGTRIYPDGPPATAALPSLCYTYVWSEHARNLVGAAGMAEYRLRFECRSLVQADNEALALQVRMLFNGRIGDVSGLRLQYCSPEHELDRYVPPLPGSDNGTHYKRFDMLFKVREAVPFTYTAS